MWAYNEKVPVYKPGREGPQEEGPPQEVNLLAPWSWTSQSPEQWETNICCLSDAIYGILLEKLELRER